MPSSAVHLTIANKAAGTAGVNNLPQFFLGSIAPDAVNINGFAPREIRYGAHLRSRSYSEWKKNILEFRALHENEFSDCPDFFKGVLMHLYTDIAWDEAVQPLLFEYFRTRGVRDDCFTSEKWRELDRLDSALTARSEYPEILSQLKTAEPHPFGTVSAEQLALWRDMIVSEKAEIHEPPAFLADEHITIALVGAIKLFKTGR